MTTKEIKERLLKVDKKQIDLIPEICKRGYSIQPTELSAFVCGRLTTPKAKSVLALCEEILCEWEAEQAKMAKSVV